MRRLLLAAVCIVLLPAVAQATAYSVTVTGDAGSGFATIDVAGDDIDYNILVSGMEPTTATLTDGSDSLDLAASFVNGSAFGGVTDADTAAAILGDPSAWSLEVTDGTDTVSGPLSAGGGGGETVVYIPVSASNPGANETFFRTDARIINRSGEAVTATLDFYRNDDGGNTDPDASETVEVAANEQLVLEDFLVNLFGFATAQGAVKVTADRSVIVASRVYNDQTSVSAGTQGLFVDSRSMNLAYQSGTISFLQNRNRNSGEGFRGALGWFNPNSGDVTLTLYGWDTDGTLLGSETVTVSGLEQKQQFIQAIWPALAGYGDMYVTYAASDSIFVYGTITDNVSGDGTYIPATQGP